MARIRRHTGRVELCGEVLDYDLVRVPGRKRVHLVVAEGSRLEVRAPYHFPHRAAQEAIRAHGQWALRALRQAREVAHPPLVNGAALPLLDATLRLCLRAGGRRLARLEGESLHVQAPSLGAACVGPVVEDWYRREARAYLAERLWNLATTLGVSPGRVSIRGQKTRWGSCSSRGTISLNWRLMLLPAWLVDYVLVHELCHLRHLDHSPRFWAEVEAWMPDWRHRRAQLRARSIQGLAL